MVRNFVFVFVLLTVLNFGCKKDDVPEKKNPESNYFIMANQYYETPNAYLIPVDTLLTYAISYLYLSDGEMDNESAIIRNYKQIVFIDLNTEISDSSLNGEFEPVDTIRHSGTYASAKLIIAELGKQMIAKNGQLTIQQTDSSTIIEYSFIFDDNTIISGNYDGNIEIKNIELKNIPVLF